MSLTIAIDNTLEGSAPFMFLWCIGESLSVTSSPDVIFAPLYPGAISVINEQYPNAIKIGVQHKAWWSFGDYGRCNDMYNTIKHYDVVIPMSENVMLCAESLNKLIWQYPYLMKGDIISKFCSDKQDKQYYSSVNVYQHDISLFSWSIPFAMANNFGTYYLPTLTEMDLSYDLPNIKMVTMVNRKEWLEFLQSECKLLFQHSKTPSLGKSCLDAVMVGIPVIASPFYYQCLLYPGLVIHTVDDAVKLLSSDYELFRPHVEMAQDKFSHYNTANTQAVSELRRYIENCYETITN